jgi:hypothetical protein
MSDAVSQIFGTAIGTVGAVATVFITEWIRNVRKARIDIPERLRVDRGYIVKRIAAIEQALTPDSGGRFTTTRAMRFDVAAYQRLASEAFYHLSAEQRQAVANIVFVMGEADEANAEAVKLIDIADSVAVGMHQLQNLSRREKFLLERVRDQIDEYLGGAGTAAAPIAP